MDWNASSLFSPEPERFVIWIPLGSRKWNEVKCWWKPVVYFRCWHLLMAGLTSVVSLCDKCAAERNRCDWSHPVTGEPTCRLIDQAHCFIIDVIVLYIRARPTESTLRREDVCKDPSLRSLGQALHSASAWAAGKNRNMMTSWLLYLVSFYCFARMKCA